LLTSQGYWRSGDAAGASLEGDDILWFDGLDELILFEIDCAETLAGTNPAPNTTSTVKYNARISEIVFLFTTELALMLLSSLVIGIIYCY
jgi:hypothetical protein